MASCCSEALTVEKFMFCIPLRTGTKIITWLTLLYSICVYILLFSYLPSRNITTTQSGEVTVLILVTLAVLCSGIGYSAGTLLYLPSPYETNFESSFCCFSVNRAKCIRNFAGYNIFVAVYIVTVYIFVCMGSSDSKFQEFNLDFYKLLQTAFLMIFQSGLHLHFAAVLRSHYKSII